MIIPSRWVGLNNYSLDTGKAPKWPFSGRHWAFYRPFLPEISKILAAKSTIPIFSSYQP